MSEQEPRNYGYVRGPFMTKTDRELSDADIEALSAEAEGGYDVSHLLAVPEMYRWDVGLKFRLTRGEFDLDAEHALYAEGVRREMHAGAFRYVSYVEAPTGVTAHAMVQARLFDMLRLLDAEAFVFDARVVCLGQPK